MKSIKPKKGRGLEIRTFQGKDSGRTYLVFQTPAGGFNTFVETDSKAAAMDCGSELPRRSNTRQHWRRLWEAKGQ